MKPISHMNAAEIRPFFEEVLAVADDFWDASPVFGDPVASADDRDLVAQAVELAEAVRNRHPAFFAEMPYAWAFSPDSFRLPTDARLQAYALALLAGLWKYHSDYPMVEPAAFGGIGCRTVVSAGILSTSPRALRSRAGSAGGMIAVPSGWINGLDFLLDCAAALADGRAGDAARGAREVALRCAAEQQVLSIEEELRADLPPEQLSLVSHEVRRLLAEDPIILEETRVGAYPWPEVSSEWTGLRLAGLTFLLAHEMAHLLCGDQRRPASAADEELADGIAFDAVARSAEWKKLSRELPVQDGLGKTALAAAVFIGSGLTQTGLQTIFEPKKAARLRAFRARARSLLGVAAVQPIPDQDRIRVSEYASVLTAAWEFILKEAGLRAADVAGMRGACERVFRRAVAQVESVGDA